MILYKRNQSGVPVYWSAKLYGNILNTAWGIVAKSKTEYTYRSVDAKHLASIIKAKKKEGYYEIYEIRDADAPFKVPEESNVASNDAIQLASWLNTYLPLVGVFADGKESVMLAKLFDIDTIIKRDKVYLDQPKINGERCNITVEKNDSMFHPYRLRFWSRLHNEFMYIPEYWAIELLTHIPPKLFDKMLSGEVTLDGELYIPGYKVNQINHVIKSPDMLLPDKKKLEYWMYDLMWDSVPQRERLNFLNEQFDKDVNASLNGRKLKEFHYSKHTNLVYLGYWKTSLLTDHRILRDHFIKSDFEGVILRESDATYQFGKRNYTMIKYKEILEGNFKIIDVIPEGVKRPDLAKLVCRNDINDETFDCSIAVSHEFRKHILRNKELYVGGEARVEYRERSGVKQVPFHQVCVGIDSADVVQ